MRARRIKIILMSAVVLSAALIFARTAAFTFFYAPDEAPAAPAPPAAMAHVASSPAMAPKQLIIPALNITAPVQYVGVNTKGNMMAPSNFTDVSWYKYGPAPGEIGSAVMAGHVDNGLGLDGVFKHLSDLKAGDDLYVMTAKGTKLHFVVSAVQVYPFDAVPADLLFSQADAAHLNLVTCDGAWVTGAKTYDHRLVVFSTLQSS